MSKNYTVMELEAIKKLCKSVNLIANLPTNLIADTNVATNTTYSSYKIDAEMSALENDIQRYVDTALAGLNKLTKEVIDDKTLVVKENVLYLYKDPTDMNNDYMQMMLINGVAVELGSTTCDFSSVYSKDEIDDKFALKIDLDVLTTSFNNLVTSVENKIDKDSIATVLDDSVTDEQIASAKVIQEELDKKIDKDNLVTVLDDTVTDEQILNALALKELLDEKNVENLFPIQYYNNTSDTRTGITATINNDRSITFKGTTTGQYFFVLWHKDNNGLGKAVALRGKTITMTGGLASPTLSLAFYDEEGNNITPPDNAMKYDFGDGLTIKVPDNAYSVYSYYYSSANKTLDCTVYPMFEIGNVAHDYCPPNGTALTKGDIGDSINSDSTADEIVSAKLAHTNLIRGNYAVQSYLDEIGTNDVLQFPEGKYIISENVTYANLPEGVVGGYLEIWNMNGKSYETPFNSAWKYRVVKLQDFDSKKSYYRVLRAGSSSVFIDTGWQRVCVTKVADVAKTDITPVFPSGVVVASGGVYMSYVVRNGWCNVNFVFNVTSATTFPWTDIATGLPKPANNANIVLMSEGGKATQPIAIKINSTGSVSSRVPSAISTTDWWTGNISYPVAE